jgi:nitrate/nitrite transporter NarK
MTASQPGSIRDSKAARWAALGIVSFTMLAAYFVADVMSPLKTMLESQCHWTSSDFGVYTSAYGWFNVFLFMLILGGLILDRMGIRFTGIMATLLMVVGAGINYWGLTASSLTGQEWLGLKASVLVASLGYALFAVGCEVSGITVQKVIVRWYKGKEMALAMGVQVALARIGTMLAMEITVPIATAFQSVSAPVFVGMTLLCVGMLAFWGYTVLDKKLDRESRSTETEAEEPFQLSDVKLNFSNRGFWLIALLCVLFYACVFPFLKYATDLMVNKFNVPINLAGLIPGVLPFGTILLTPLFGGIYDKKGHGASIMILGAFLLLIVHILFSIPFLNQWWMAVGLMILLGIAFSLVPSAMWPSVAKIIPEKQLGTAYALIFWIQNIGLMGVPFLVGKVLDRYCRISPAGETPRYDYTLVMMLFSCLAFLSILVAFTLKKEDKRRGYGLEQKNVSK